MKAWPAPYASNRLHLSLPCPPDTWESVARELYKHLVDLNGLLYDKRYTSEGPCAGCYDAQYRFEAYAESPAARAAAGPAGDKQ